MKTLKLFILIAVPALVLSCNNPNKQRDKNNNRDRNNRPGDTRSSTKKDTLSQGSFMIRLSTKDQSEDEDFLKEAANGGLMEVELGRYAEQNAGNPRVQKFGAMMVRDHSKANDELKTLARSKNVQIPSEMDNSHQRKADDLKQKKGGDFDTDYMKDMVDDHETDVDKFQKEAENGKDNEVKAFATKTLPVLLMHLDSAKAVRDALKK
jgi:putative membrane protein